MSDISAWEHRDLYIWTVERPVEGRVRYSPEFTYKEDCRYHKFGLEFFVENKTYTMSFRNNSAPLALRYLPIDVHVEDRGGRILPLSYKVKHKPPVALIYTSSVWGSVLWKYKEPDILKVIPDFHSNGLLIFLIIFYSSYGTTLLGLYPDFPIRKADKFTQKDGETVQKEEKCVQTPSYIGVTSCLESLSKDLSKVVDQSYHSDMLLCCGGRMVRVHKLVLSARSKVFANMLHNDSDESSTGTVQIQDMDPEIFDHFVRYIYTGNLPELTVDSAKLFYGAAEKYAVAGLSRRCVHFFQENINCKNACSLLEIADAHGDVEFKETAMDYILEKKVHLQDDIWLPFCKCQPVLANQVLNRFCKLHNE